MELNQLYYFLAVAKTENITKAAQELFITQPALSRVILRLETELGTPLFDRRGGRLVLNENGELFLSYIKPAIDFIDNGVYALTGRLGSRKIEIHNYLISDIFSLIAEKCLAEFPNMTFTVKNIRINADESEMNESEPDIVLTPTSNFKSYIFHRSFNERWCVLYNKQYQFEEPLEGRTMTLRQLSREPIVFSGSEYDRLFIEQVFAQAGISHKVTSGMTLSETRVQINRCKAVGFVPVSNFRNLINRVWNIPICAAAISDAECSRKLYLCRSPKFSSNADESRLMESIENYIANEYAVAEEFYETYFSQA